MEQTIPITKANALKAYNGADDKTKAVLEKLLGKENLSQKITDRVKTFEDACAIVDPSTDILAVLRYASTDKDVLAAQALLKLTIIARALNEGWVADWGNHDQSKYIPYFIQTASGFSCDVYVTWFTLTSAPGRLCYKSSELARYAGDQFADIYKYLIHNN